VLAGFQLGRRWQTGRDLEKVAEWLIGQRQYKQSKGLFPPRPAIVGHPTHPTVALATYDPSVNSVMVQAG